MRCKRLRHCQHSFVPFSSVAVRDFTLIPQHTSPESAVRELNALYDVVADVRARWNNDVFTAYK